MSYGISHKGHIRQENQDMYLNIDHAIGELENLFVLADGMGGHHGGSIASKTAVDAIADYVSKNQGEAMDLIENALIKANNSIYKKAVEDDSLFGMGTTVDVVSVKNGHLKIGHVGDSRIYVVAKKEIIQITKDHSYVQELIDAGAITEGEAKVHPARNQITNAAGMEEGFKPEMMDIKIKRGWETLLMCSDGLTNMVDDQTIFHIIKESASLEDGAGKLVNKALEQGGLDNITLVLAQLKGGL